MTARTNAIAAAIAACAVLFAVPAAAVDGEILIDQAKVNAGGITPGDAPGFPATLGKSGRYKLTGNLRVPAGQYGIEVTQHDVSIDLNGFTISSNPPGQALDGVVASGRDRLRVMNGTIAGFENFGIAQPGTGGAVENMRIVSSGTGVYIASEGRIRNSMIANGLLGIGCGRCLIEQNVITGNTTGIIAYGAVVLGNVIASNVNGLGSPSGEAKTGYGNNILFDNSDTQVSGPVIQLHPNVCDPACP